MSYYTRHIFFCTNIRPEGADRPSCGRCGSEALRNFAKQRVKELGLSGRAGVRVNTSGCLDRCEEGPVAVVYPEATWYTYVDEEDVEEIVTSHLRDGVAVERLKI
ncbi:MAG TPA: (2Fe-2S) ferredoxin domain-containing protein [Gammaproteobacteria bacterium]